MRNLELTDIKFENNLLIEGGKKITFSIRDRNLQMDVSNDFCYHSIDSTIDVKEIANICVQLINHIQSRITEGDDKQHN